MKLTSAPRGGILINLLWVRVPAMVLNPDTILGCDKREFIPC